MIVSQEGGCSWTEEAPKILDRLAGLQQVLPPEVIRQVLQETGQSGQRRCLLHHEVMMWVVLGMGLLTELPIRQVFKYARRLRPGEGSPDRSALCQGRQRLGVAPVRRLFQELTRPLAELGNRALQAPLQSHRRN